LFRKTRSQSKRHRHAFELEISDQAGSQSSSPGQADQLPGGIGYNFCGRFRPAIDVQLVQAGEVIAHQIKAAPSPRTAGWFNGGC
jgi:hypothetical protein